jgi:hypothetical protein
MSKKHCECCGAPLVEYKHSLSKGIARCLYKLAQAGGGPIKLNELPLNHTQQCNMPKLQYWGLIEKSHPDSARAGIWNITELGWSFLRAEMRINKCAITFRGNVERTEGDSVSIKDLTDGWWHKPEYVEHSSPRDTA